MKAGGNKPMLGYRLNDRVIEVGFSEGEIDLFLLCCYQTDSESLLV
jgi:hypothetical protein